MTIMEAINRHDNLNFNGYSQEQKIRWLSSLDTAVKQDVFDTHEGGGGIAFTGYDSGTSPDTQLLVPEPWDEVYVLWLEAQIAYHNGEYKKYNNATMRFEARLQEFKNYWHRNHRPITPGRRFLF
jgi:hypothetical protein